MTDTSVHELDQLAEELTLQPEVNKRGTICYLNEQNQLHRIHGPAVIYTDGSEYWYQNGHLHRLSSPAVILCTGSKFWYQGNKMHRLDGPAAIYSDGNKRWYIDGEEYTEDEFNLHPDVIAYAKSK